MNLKPISMSMNVVPIMSNFNWNRSGEFCVSIVYVDEKNPNKIVYTKEIVINSNGDFVGDFAAFGSVSKEFINCIEEMQNMAAALSEQLVDAYEKK